MHQPPWQASPLVQGFPSEHGLASLATCWQPRPSTQASSVQGSPSSQNVAPSTWLPPQSPPASQTSSIVHGSPSSQGTSGGTSMTTQPQIDASKTRRSHAPGSISGCSSGRQSSSLSQTAASVSEVSATSPASASMSFVSETSETSISSKSSMASSTTSAAGSTSAWPSTVSTISIASSSGGRSSSRASRLSAPASIIVSLPALASWPARSERASVVSGASSSPQPSSREPGRPGGDRHAARRNDSATRAPTRDQARGVMLTTSNPGSGRSLGRQARSRRRVWTRSHLRASSLQRSAAPR